MNIHARLKAVFTLDSALGERKLNLVTVKKLCCFISDDLCDDNDIKQQVRCAYTKRNVLINKFRQYADHVKITPFNSYCTNFFYLCTFWNKFTAICKSTIVTAHKKVF